MKAPDKVYYTQTKYVANYFTIGKPFEGDCVEYIRKDALLEWANNWLAFKRSGVAIDDGFCCAMEELIKKLNEM